MSREVSLKYGHIQKLLTLTASQSTILTLTDPRAVISGPPGCGKSLVLMLQGLQWLQEGHDVLVFGLHAACLPASRQVYLQLSEAYKQSQEALPAEERTWGKVRFKHQVLHDRLAIDATLRLVLKHGDAPRVIMDDFCPEDEYCVELMLDFMKQLLIRSPNIQIWATNWSTRLPEDFPVHMLTQPLRYPVPLLREVSMGVEVVKSADLLPETHAYSERRSDALFHPDVINLRHNTKSVWPVNSEKCGRRVAKILRNIGVGAPAGDSGSEDRYEYRDVLIITRNSVNPSQPPPAFLQGLQDAGVPTQMISQTNMDSFDNFLLARQDKVTLLNSEAARGLDRPVVVCLTGVSSSEDWELTKEKRQDIVQNLQASVSVTPGGRGPTITFTPNLTKAELKAEMKSQEHRMKATMELKHRLTIWSRCSKQLIVVHLPKGMEGGPSGSENYEGSGRKCSIL